jgi:hypothetical protein
LVVEVVVVLGEGRLDCSDDLKGLEGEYGDNGVPIGEDANRTFVLISGFTLFIQNFTPIYVLFTIHQNIFSNQDQGM